MTVKSLMLNVSPEIGNVSAECIMPENCSCIMTLAHGAGAGMNHSFMVQLANALAETGIATLRFNFPFMENKKGPADKPAAAHQTIAAAIAKAKELFPACINGIHFQNPLQIHNQASILKNLPSLLVR